MKETKLSIYPFFAGFVYAILGIVGIVGFVNTIKYGFSFWGIIEISVYIAISLVLFSRKRNAILPVLFSVIAILGVFSLRDIMTQFLPFASLAIICFGEFTNYLKDFYKIDTKKIWYIPAVIQVVVLILFEIFISGSLFVSFVFFANGLLRALGCGLVGLWIAYPDKVYNINIISSQNGDTEDVINSIYECYCESVKSGLKAPTTAVFCKPEELRIKEIEGTYVVSGWVDSQNSYGAMIRTNFTLNMKKENGKFVSKTNIYMLGSKQFAANYIAITIMAIVMTAILFFLSYIVVESIL